MTAVDENSQAPPFRLRSLTLSVYTPTLLFAMGQGALMPFVILFAVDNLGAAAAISTLVVSLRGIGTMVFDVPAGMVIARFGERRAVLFSSLGLLAVMIGAANSVSILMYAVMIFLMGVTTSIWMLARLTFVSEQAPPEQRGRAIALLAGTNRIGQFVGPFVGAAIVAVAGIEGTFYFQGLIAVVAMLTLLAFTQKELHAPVAHEEAAFRRLLGIIRDHRHIFATAGFAAIAVHLLRTGRQVIIPLWGTQLGIDNATIGIIFGISSAIDMLAFYPMGIVMDRFGRKWAAIPCLVVMAIGMMAIPLTNDFQSLAIAGFILGLGNGFGSGIVMTLGADFSPREGRSEFLGVWRLITDVGIAGGPLVIAGMIWATTLGIASVGTGGLGLIGALVMLLLVPEPLRYRERSRDP